LIFAVLVLRVNDCRPYTPFKLLSFSNNDYNVELTGVGNISQINADDNTVT